MLEDSPRSLGGREMTDHAHGDDSGAVHSRREGRGHINRIKVKDESVSFSPKESVCPREDDLVVGGMKSFLREDPTAADTRGVGRGLDDDVITKLIDGEGVVDHDLSQGDEGVASIQATSGENTPQGSCFLPRSLDGDEIVDHVHGRDDG